jgi:hypothetical protein
MAGRTGAALEPKSEGPSIPEGNAVQRLISNRYVLKVRTLLTQLSGFFGRWRVPLCLAALVLFLAGAIWSLQQLDLAYDQLNWIAFLGLTIGLTLPNLCYSALSMVWLGRTAGVEISFAQAFRTGILAQLAEVLPLPGGALVRAAALAKAGTTVSTSAILVVATAVIWVGLSLLGAGVHLVTSSPAIGSGLLAGGLLLTVIPSLLIMRLGGFTNMAVTLLIRIAGLALLAWRIVLAFACLNVAADMVSTMPYVFATVAGSASSIVPGGLGISEALGASLAHIAEDIRPETAFLAVAINRVASFLGTALFALVIQLSELVTKFLAGRPS